MFSHYFLPMFKTCTMSPSIMLSLATSQLTDSALNKKKNYKLKKELITCRALGNVKERKRKDKEREKRREKEIEIEELHIEEEADHL